MKAQHLKSKTISEDTNYQVEQLIQQLDNVKHIADSDFWISTDEIKIGSMSLFWDSLESQ